MMLTYLITGGEVHDKGGLSKYVRELANYCVSAGFYVKIVSRMGKITPIGSENLSINKNGNKKGVSKLSFSPFYFMLSHLPNPLTVILGLLTIIKDIKREYRFRKILHVHDASSSLLIAFILNKIYDIPFLVQIHGFPLKEQKIKLLELKHSLSGLVLFLTKLWHTMAVRLIKNATLVLVNNREVRSFYEACGISLRRLEVMPSAIDLREFRRHLLPEEEARKCLGLSNPKNGFAIGFIGTLRPEKNVKTLLNAFGEFLKSCPEAKARVVIIGDGPMRSALEEYVKTQGIDDCASFLGYIPDAYGFLNSIDVFVLPSLSEGSPFSLIEAMAAGKAIIASDIPAIREMVEDGKEALLFDPYNPRQLKDLILTLYNNPELRKKLGENARRKAEQYDVNIIFPKILQTYKKILRSSAN